MNLFAFFLILFALAAAIAYPLAVAMNRLFPQRRTR